MSFALPAIDVSSLGRVAVLMGGSSAEREISLMSGTGVLAALQSLGVNAQAFDPAQRDLGELKREGFDRVFIALHGRHGEDGTVQGALELLGIPYTGSGVMASAIAMDKTMTKRVWLASNLPTPRFVLLDADDQSRERVRAVPGDLGWRNRLRLGQRTISMRMPVSSQNGSRGIRLIARPDARRAVNSRAPACSMWTAAAPTGGVRVITSSTPGRRSRINSRRSKRPSS